ncbi:MAG: hypothetical protein KDI51_15605, partial [Xanthomonadales bacterium]|nr:hypothetical protein [Xanthomonadales bacterium]
MRTDADARSIWKEVNSLEFQIEESASTDPGENRILNMYGEYDRVDLTDRLFAAHDQMIEWDATDMFIVYRYAGSLLRARRIDAARALYLRCGDAMPAAELMLACLEANFGREEDAQHWLNLHNERCDVEGMECMKSDLSKIKLKEGLNKSS